MVQMPGRFFYKTVDAMTRQEIHSKNPGLDPVIRRKVLRYIEDEIMTRERERPVADDQQTLGEFTGVGEE